jgi:hypothetical protein
MVPHSPPVPLGLYPLPLGTAPPQVFAQDPGQAGVSRCDFILFSYRPEDAGQPASEKLVATKSRGAAEWPRRTSSCPGTGLWVPCPGTGSPGRRLLRGESQAVGAGRKARQSQRE